MKKRLVLLASIALAGLAGCTNPEVPAGHEGYVYYKPLIFGQMEFRESLPGPATTGISWRLWSINIDMRARSYKEDFELLTKENLTVSFEVNTRLRLRPGSVQDIVENWGGANWYEWNIKERLRTTVREQVPGFSALAIQLETQKVRAQIEDVLRLQLETDPVTGKPSPILIESVDIGEIHFPAEVADAIERKIATKQELARQRFLLAKTKKEAAIKVLEAIRVAKQQLIISSTLDPLYVQQRAIQVYRRVAKSNNQTTIVLPNSNEGTALPLILEPKTRRVLSKADKDRINKDLDALELEFKRDVKQTLNGVDLEGVDLEGADLEGADLKLDSEGAVDEGGDAPAAPGEAAPGEAAPGEAATPGEAAAPGKAAPAP